MPIRLWRSRARRIAREAADWRAEMLEPPTPDVQAEFQTWLAADPAHARAYDELEPFATLSQRLPRPVRERQHRTGIAVLRPALVALAVVLALAGALLAVAREPSAAVAAVVNPGPAIRAVRLEDGSTLTLDADTALDVALGPASREIRLRQGRARFNVAALPNRPLRISTGAGSVTTEGALLDVALDERGMTVSALSGRAIVTAGSNTSRSAPLIANATLRVGGDAIVAIDVSQAEWRWPAGRLAFDNTPLEKIVAMANRLDAPPIRLADPGLGAVQVTAVLDVRDTRALAHKLGSAFDLRVREDSSGILLSR
jgi:transmembrane sensor